MFKSQKKHFCCTYYDSCQVSKQEAGNQGQVDGIPERRGLFGPKREPHRTNVNNRPTGDRLTHELNTQNWGMEMYNDWEQSEIHTRLMRGHGIQEDRTSRSWQYPWSTTFFKRVSIVWLEVGDCKEINNAIGLGCLLNINIWFSNDTSVAQCKQHI